MMSETYKGIPVDSESEIMVLDWLFELQDKGLVLSIERAPEMLISSGLSNNYLKRTVMKTKTKVEPKVQSILSSHYYTPEFLVKWSIYTPNALVWDIANIGSNECKAPLIAHNYSSEGIDTECELTYFEVKPAFDFKNMSRLFKLNRLWVWESRKIFINLVEPMNLYKHTFTPQVYLHTRKRKTEREIKWDIITVDQYLNSIGYETQTTLQPLEDGPHN